MPRWLIAIVAALVLAASLADSGARLAAQPSQGGRLQATLLSAVTSGTSQGIDVRGLSNLTIYIQSTGTVSGGTLLVEEAFYDPSSSSPAVYSLTWSQVKSLAAGTDFGTNSQTAFHAATAAYRNVRVRISSNITGGGTITVFLVGQ